MPTYVVMLNFVQGYAKVLQSSQSSSKPDRSVKSKLCLPRKRTPFPILVSGIGQASAHVTHFVTADIFSLHSDFKIKLRLFVLPHVTARLPVHNVDITGWNIPEHICLADPTFCNTNSVDLIIGAEHFFKILQYGRIELGCDRPLLQNTALGWVVTGACGQGLSQQTVCNLQQSSPLEELVKRFWQLETCHDLQGWSPEERACEQFFLDTTVRNSEGRYVVKLPRRKELISQLRDNRYNAERRFNSLERRLDANPELKLQYHEFIREYEALGHMREVKVDELHADLQYFLPHHAVLKPESSTTKLRTVFDASCKSKSGLSLNDVLLTGPTIQDTLVSIVFRFRMHAFVAVADISKMYRQILVHRADQPLQRILFRFSTEEPIKVYQLLTVTYGTNCAPFLATRVLQKLADDEAENFPDAAPVVRKSFYVDDMLAGSSSAEELKAILKQVTGMVESAGFSLRKWASNSSEVLSDIPLEFHEKTTTLDLDNESSVTTLGLQWDTLRDELRFKQPKWIPTDTITKRIVLSQLASLFDPLGLISPAIVKAKIFMQALWKHQIDWDTPLPSAVQLEWREYQQQMAHLGQVSVPRFVLPMRNANTYELHGFSDASEAAYGACLYIRSITPDGFCTVRLLSAKSRVAPIDSKSIPRLELCAALLLAHLLEKFLDSVEIKAVIYLWTDSTVVLSWLASQPSSWKTFVANRVAEIQELTPQATWNHVPSEDNPADIVSRGLDLATLSKSSLWWNGPGWLATVDGEWPNKPNVQEFMEYEAKNAVAFPAVSVDVEQDVFVRFSTLRRLLNFAAWGLRFALNCRCAPNLRQTGPLTIEEKNEAMLKLVKQVQEEYFPSEFAALRENKPVPRSSKLRFLKPRIVDGLIRVGGRLHHAEIDIDAKFPLVLPGKHHFTNLIAWAEHYKTLHGGPQLLLSTMRQRFWPLGGRIMVRRIVHSCVTCTRAKPQVLQQLIGNLPHDRVTGNFVFESVGVDFAGPMYLRSGVRFSQQVKGYIAIFVCLATKAAHFELVMSLTTSAFVAALKRFISRRGKPANLYCDNAKNFRGASTQLEALRKLFISQNHKKEILCFCESNGIRFHFIPPRSPSFGGLWEACVKSTKFHLRRIVGKAQLNKEQFETVLAEIEACLNSRPITPLSMDPSDLQALTPSHFIIGRPMNAMPEPDLTAAPPNRLTGWQHMQQIAQHFWKRWHSEYLSSLQQCYRWSTATRNLVVGSIVVVKEDNLPPLTWPLARVIDVHPGADGLVRVATVRTAKGTYKRAISKLCLLPVEVDTTSSPPHRMAAGSSTGDDQTETTLSQHRLRATRRALLEHQARTNQPVVQLVDIRQHHQQQ
ncbi:uncharacterized protein LOC134208994 [Armigeres subalbatus]|uniref:uncharacterized protein LOC134208994 n=1 Tax=Armigeres subalbatus TaxID=124917 RepID=UPI002ED68A92